MNQGIGKIGRSKGNLVHLFTPGFPFKSHKIYLVISKLGEYSHCWEWSLFSEKTDLENNSIHLHPKKKKEACFIHCFP
jgi:hypothetical protein